MKHVVVIEAPDDMPSAEIIALTDDLQAHIDGISPPKTETYPYPVGPGWVCFHCGQRFLTGWFARRHFGTVGPDGTPEREAPRCIS